MSLINIVFICLICIVSHQAQIFSQSITLHGCINNPVIEDVSISFYEDPLQNQLIENKYSLDGKNQFSSEFDFDTPKLLEIKYDNNSRKIYVEPGDNISFKFDGENFYNSWVFTGKGSTNNTFLYNLNNRFPIRKRYQFISSNIKRHYNSIDSLLTEVQTYINIESKKNKLSHYFLDYTHSDILFQSAINKIFYLQKNYVMSGNIDEQTSSYLEFMNKVNMNSNNNLYVESFPKLIFMYLDCLFQIENPELLFKIRTTNVPLLKESERVKLFKTISEIRDGLAKRLFYGKTLDYFLSKELIGLFNQGWIKPFDQLYKEYKYEGVLTEYTKLVDAAYEKAFLLRVGNSAPNFKLFDLDNNEISLDDMKGHVVLINFWASWCKPCKTSIPKIKKINTHFSNDEFRIVNICLDENIKGWKATVVKEQMIGLHLYAKGFTSQVAKDYDVQSIPRYFLLDKDGKIVEKIKGSFNSQTLISKIGKLL